MTWAGINTVGALHRYSAKRVAKPVNFWCLAPQAASVSVVGDFNNWDGNANPMRRQPDGSWTIQATLTHGHHQYYFLVDGHPTLDPRAQGVTRNARNERVSMIAVS